MPQRSSPPPRIGVERPYPLIDCGRFAAKRIVGDEVEVSAGGFRELPGDGPLGAPAQHTEDIQRRMRQASQSAGGSVIRHHGDFHLGQAMRAGQRRVVVDFEREPSRPLAEWRLKRPPLRHVAAMPRSFAYAVATGRERRARERFLVGYRSSVDSKLVPSGDAQFRRMLELFEFEKAIYELRYEIDHRPERVAIPVAAIERLLADEGE